MRCAGPGAGRGAANREQGSADQDAVLPGSKIRFIPTHVGNTFSLSSPDTTTQDTHV
ncbi:protein of unknown function [Methanoculleus bourgensis]|uniref:Uncharacterized protein n=1 Tax=Methanoculleus bourgensis TaxID=83986 RepID=A0A0X3BHN7_9EURY|nr:protein of unknown function [Methanoculleus bourgensis]